MQWISVVGTPVSRPATVMRAVPGLAGGDPAITGAGAKADENDFRLARSTTAYFCKCSCNPTDPLDLTLVQVMFIVYCFVLGGSPPCLAHYQTT